MQLPGLSSQQQGIGIRKDLAEVSANIIMPVRKRPAAMGKTAIRIFGGTGLPGAWITPSKVMNS